MRHIRLRGSCSWRRGWRAWETGCHLELIRAQMWRLIRVCQPQISAHGVPQPGFAHLCGHKTLNKCGKRLKNLIWRHNPRSALVAGTIFTCFHCNMDNDKINISAALAKMADPIINVKE
jgi:hypothetical protein